MRKLSIKAAKDIADKYDLDQVILIVRDHKKNMVGYVTYGKTKADCGFAAMDGRKLRAVVENSPTSLADAIEIANKIRPSDVPY
ncbi:MAG: hypothetical protein GY862_29555 [Gammaproteobacteria bacterium]|nr:hypothetical protein [Gammaproteobacteria bacterium]